MYTPTLWSYFKGPQIEMPENRSCIYFLLYEKKEVRITEHLLCTESYFRCQLCQLIFTINAVTEAQINQIICLAWHSQQTGAINPVGMGTSAFCFPG